MAGHDDSSNFSRRTFMKGVGATAGAAALGAGATGSAGATDADDLARFLNWRVREASRVWEKGIRGRPDRTIGLTDSGIDARHPDVGPWNGVRVTTEGGEATVVQNSYELLDGEGLRFEGTVGPGTDGTEFAGDQAEAGATYARNPFDAPADADRVEASLAWTPDDQGGQDLALVLERKVDGSWETVDSAGGILSNPQALGRDIEAGGRYALTVQTEANVRSDYEIDALFYDDTAPVETTTEPILEPKEIGTGQFTGSDAGVVAAGQTTTKTFTASKGTERVEATLTWTPENPQGPEFTDVEFELQTRNGRVLASSADAPLGGSGEFQEENSVSLAAAVDERELQFYVTCWRGVANWTIDASYQELVDSGETRTIEKRVEQEPDTIFPTGDEAVTPKVVGWYDAGPRYGEYARPRDADGHGTHVSSIMAGTGRASAIDVGSDETRVDEPRAVLAAGQTLTYEVSARAGTGVFASVYGREVDVLIEGPDGRTLAESRLIGTDSSMLDNNVAETPTVHDSNEATYTVIVRPPEGELVSVGQVEQVAVGRFLKPEESDGDRSGAPSTLHGGVAPDASLVGLQGLGTPTEDLGFMADFFAKTFNLRSVNMSWGNAGGLPLGATGFFDTSVDDVKSMARAGVLTVAAAGNSFTPANGNSEPAVADEAISVVSTGPLDGIVAYSSGGVGGRDEDGEGTYTKPDVTAPGGRAPAYPASIAAPVYDLIDAARAEDPDTPADELSIRGYTGMAGTSMASPYANGVAGLVAQAMEERAPPAIRLLPPKQMHADLDESERLAAVMRLKSAILATANETAFTAAPYHSAKTVPHQPTYDHGGRDPYEGYGRVNPDAAVEAVSRELVDASAAAPEQRVESSYESSVGLNVPEDARAVAGYVEAEGGTLEAGVEFTHYSGANKGMTMGSPHLDLFVYDAENPAANGDPRIVASAAGPQGSASVTVDGAEGVYYVVAKIVNVPGVVNGYDVQANFDFGVEYVGAPLPAFTATGERTDDGDVFTGGDTNQVEITVSGLSELSETTSVEIRDALPQNWTVDTRFGDAERVEDGEVVLGTVTPDAVDADPEGGSAAVTFTYFAEAPSSADESGPGTFGPAKAIISESASDANDVSNEVATFAGTDRAVVVGTSTETSGTGGTAASPSTSSSGSGDGDVVSDATDSVL